MNWYLVDKPVSLYIEFKQGDEFVIPDTGSIKLTLRGNDGVAILGQDNLALANCLVTSMPVLLAAVLNTVGVGLPFETRYARVDYTSGSQPLFTEVIYRVSPFIPLTGTAAEVRAVFGVRELELPNSDIDLHTAYFALLEDYATALAGTLTAPATSRMANRAVVLKAALQVAPSMSSRGLKEDSMNTATQIRGDVDWMALQNQILAELGVVLGKLEIAAGIPGGTSPTPILVLSIPVDAVTNA